MTLKKYEEKRDLKSSKEPKAKVKNSKKMPVFCVQKHDASHLHYDFRIECRGVMLSWAVPKGPSLNPADKRLAIHVEDHPLDYRNFEGVIPKGNYGAGNVLIWDEGVYAVMNEHEKLEIENKVLKGFDKGHIEIFLLGEKLKGGFLLQRLKRGSEKEWLLIKLDDEYASRKKNVLKLDKSVRTGKKIDEV